MLDGSQIKRECTSSPMTFIKDKKFDFLNITKDDTNREYDVFYILHDEEKNIKKKVSI